MRPPIHQAIANTEVTWGHKPEMIRARWDDPDSPLWVHPWVWFVYNPPEGADHIRHFNAVLK